MVSRLTGCAARLQSTKAEPNPTFVYSVLMLVRSHEPASVPTTIPSIISQSLFTRARKSGPVNNCQKLVTKDGMTNSVAAAPRPGRRT